MTKAKKPCLEIANLDFSYVEISALKNISFSVNKGEVLGIIGPNGAGKTTLSKCLLKSAIPMRGSISLLGKPLSAYSSKQLARLVSLQWILDAGGEGQRKTQRTDDQQTKEG